MNEWLELFRVDLVTKKSRCVEKEPVRLLLSRLEVRVLRHDGSELSDTFEEASWHVEVTAADAPAPQKLKHFDLLAGIGGLSLGQTLVIHALDGIGRRCTRTERH